MKRTMERVDVLEFFSGIGGLHYALERSGVPHRVVQAFDVDDSAVRTYRHNHRTTTVSTKNIVSLKSSDLRALAADCWLLSPPCQPHTRQGLQLGNSDSRSSALVHLIDLLDTGEAELLPRTLLLENVVGFESSSVRRRLYHVLVGRGYSVRELWASPAQIGVPNQRTRYFLLASMRSVPTQSSTAAVVFDRPPEAPMSSFTPLDPAALEAACMAGERVAAPRGEVDVATQQACEPLSSYLVAPPALVVHDTPTERAPQAEAETDGETLVHGAAVAEHILERYGQAMDLVGRHSRRSCCFTKNYSRYIKGTGSVVCEGVVDGAALPRHDEEKSLEALRPLRPRFFLPREVANLHGFPPHFAFPPEVGVRKQYELLGNSLSVQVVAVLLRYLLLPSSDSAAGSAADATPVAAPRGQRILCALVEE